MELLVIGAGTVGSNIARELAGEGEDHALTVVDRDADRVEALTAGTEVTGVVGDGRSVSTLRDAGLDRAEMVIACTDNDATNVMVCNTAERATDAHTVARVKAAGLLRAWQSADEGFGVDSMVCLDLLAAHALVETLALPGADAVDRFADGLAETAEFRIGEDTPVTGLSVAEADRYPSLTFAAIVRDDEVVIPDGETVIEAGDSLVVIGSSSGVTRFGRDVSDRPAPTRDDDVLVLGGDTLGYQVARLFEERDLSVHVVERDPDRAEWLATRLGDARVIEADATDMEEFGFDRLPDADFVVSALDDDANYLLTRLADELGHARTATTVDNPDLLDVFEGGDLDLVVHPQDIIAGEILEEIYRRRAEAVTVLEHDNAEVLEIAVDAESVLAGDSLSDVAQHLPDGFVVGAVVRGGTLRTPRGGTIIQTGDRVIAFVDADVASEVAEQI